MNKATKRSKVMAATVTTMVRDGMVYTHDPATVGHRKHGPACWTVILAPLGNDLDKEAKR